MAIVIKPLKDFIVTIEGDDSAEEQQREPRPLLRAELQIPQAVIDRYDTHEQQDNAHNKWKKWVEVLGLLAILGTLWATWRAATAAKDAADTVANTLRFTVDSAHLDQRAWVGVEYQPKEFEVTADKDIAFRVVMKNSGKTPAVNVTSGVMYKGVDNGQQFTPEYQSAKDGSVLVIQPDAAVELRTATVRLLPNQVQQLTDERGAIYVYGQIGYDDVFGHPHCTAFCLFYERDPKQAKFCTTYNYVTDTKCQQ